jgi:hypothetical protein
MRLRRHRTGLIGAAFVAAGLTAATEALAAPPAHLEAKASLSISEARSRCVPALVTAGEACEVGEFGRVGSVAGHRVFYARYAFKPAEPGLLPYPRIVIFESVATAMLRPILTSGDDAAFAYEKPVILRSGGRTILHIPASESGTGNFNRELLYVWRDGWRDADITSWLKDLAGQLPKGLGVWKGVYPDYATMRVSTPLWRDSDGNCCPTGGSAEIDLQWQGDRIAVRRVRVQRTGDSDPPVASGRPRN